MDHESVVLPLYYSPRTVDEFSLNLQLISSYMLTNHGCPYMTGYFACLQQTKIIDIELRTKTQLKLIIFKSYFLLFNHILFDQTLIKSLH